MRPDDPNDIFLGAEYQTDSPAGPRRYKLVESDEPVPFKDADPVVVIVIDEGERTHYVKAVEGAKSMFSVYESSPEYPMLRDAGTLMDINFFHWLTERDGDIFTVHKDETPLTDTYCYWEHQDET